MREPVKAKRVVMNKGRVFPRLENVSAAELFSFDLNSKMINYEKTSDSDQFKFCSLIILLDLKYL